MNTVPYMDQKLHVQLKFGTDMKSNMETDRWTKLKQYNPSILMRGWKLPLVYENVGLKTVQKHKEQRAVIYVHSGYQNLM